MSRILFGLALALVIASGVYAGWILSEPKGAPVGAVHLVAGAAAPAAQTASVGGADQALGWEARKTLRDHLAAAIQQIKADPCKAQHREAFLAAFAERAVAQATDNRNGAGHLWRTAEDEALNQAMLQLDKAGLTTEPERAMAAVARTPDGAAALASTPPAPATPAPVLESSTCKSELAVLR